MRQQLPWQPPPALRSAIGAQGCPSPQGMKCSIKHPPLPYEGEGGNTRVCWCRWSSPSANKAVIYEHCEEFHRSSKQDRGIWHSATVFASLQEKTLNFFKAATAFPIFRLTMRVLLYSIKCQQRMKIYLCCFIVKLKQQEAVSHLGAF